jgi:hypothetical protein
MVGFIYLALPCHVLGSVEDEWCFSFDSSLGTKLHNHLVDHLPLVVSCHNHNHFTLANLFYDDINADWQCCKSKRGRYGLIQ